MRESDGLSRRNFVTGGLGVAATAIGLGALAGCSAKEATAGAAWDDSADVVVVGCGTALGAVLSAVQAGASVIGLEKMPTVGGNWAVNQGVFWAPATDAMKANGDVNSATEKEDTLEAAVEDWVTLAKGNCDKNVVKEILTNQQAFINSLVAEGYEFHTEIPGIGTVPRGHSIVKDGKLLGGGTYTSILAERIKKTSAKIRTSTTVTRIIMDDDGKAAGVEAIDSETGKKVRIGAKAIVVATGSYTANLQMRALYSPETDGWGVIGGHYATGDGHRMLFEHDAALAAHYKVGPNVRLEKFTDGIYYTNQYSVFWVKQRSLFIADSTGQRNRDETLSYVVADTTKFTVPSYEIFDQALFDEPDFTLCVDWGRSTLEKHVEDGIIAKGNTAAELAAKLYLDPATLQKTIDDFNAAANSGKDPFGRKAETMRPLVAPYYGSTGTNATSGTALMCIKIDSDARVLSCYERPIPGVYGAGNDMVYFNYAGPNYIGSGAGCSAGYGISVYAGQKAAKFAASLAKS